MAKLTRLSKRAICLFKHKKSDDFGQRINEFVNENVSDITGVIVNAAQRAFGSISGDKFDKAVAEGWIITMENIRLWDSENAVPFHPWLSTRIKHRMIDLSRKYGKYTRTELKVLKAIEATELELIQEGIAVTLDMLASRMIQNKVASKRIVNRVILERIPQEVTWTDLGVDGQPFSNFDEEGNYWPEESDHGVLDTGSIGSMSRDGKSREEIAGNFGMTSCELRNELMEGTVGLNIEHYSDLDFLETLHHEVDKTNFLK